MSTNKKAVFWNLDWFFFSDPFISGITQELKDMEKRHTADIEINQALRAEKDAKKAEKKLSELYDADDDEDDDWTKIIFAKLIFFIIKRDKKI